MAARYAGDVFYRPLQPETETEFGKKSFLMQQFPDLKLWTPAQREFQDRYNLVAGQALKEYKAND